MKCLNLYAGLGGNRKNWKGCEVVAVERDAKIAEVYRQQHPQDELVVGDAHQYLLDHATEFDFIWSSPPCQSHSRMIRGGRNRVPRYPDMRLYEQILFLKHDFQGSWVVENVRPYYQPLIEFTSIGRHVFWSNFSWSPIEEPKLKDFDFINNQNATNKERLQEWLGIKYDGNIYYQGNHCVTQVLRNCVHPTVGEHIFNAYVDSVKRCRQRTRLNG